jgi:hypothetical protein
MVPNPLFFLFISVCLSGGMCSEAQGTGKQTACGYITSMPSPSELIVDGEHIDITPETKFAPIDADSSQDQGPHRVEMHVGTYVEIQGYFEKAWAIHAQIIRLRDDRHAKLSGLGVIDKVIARGDEPVFQADGYRIRITKASHITLPDDLNSLESITPNLWLHYEGIRDADGVLVARTAHFLPARIAKIKAIPNLDSVPVQLQPPGAAQPAMEASRPGMVKVGWGHAHMLPADEALQTRVQRIGNRMVPAYQKEFPPDHPAKIDFRFYVMEDKRREDLKTLDGAVLVSTTLMNRLQNDDQLAAVLADGIARNLQQQAARMVKNNRIVLASLAGELVGQFVPGVGLIAPIAGIGPAQLEQTLLEQRSRVALSLMADAGYDPWQAPEAWRLLAPKKLPADTSTLKYPERSGYQLNILGLQYRRLAMQVSAAPAQDEK